MRACWRLAIVSLLVAGCAQNPLFVSQQAQFAQQQTVLDQQNQELVRRAQTLDQDNQELSTLLAQSRQQNRVLEEQLLAMRDQLSGAASQVARLREEQQALARKTEAITASSRRRAGAAISANNSLQGNLPSFGIPGVQVRADGDAVRIEIPADKLFDSGSTQLRPGAGRMIEDIAADLARNYPQQFIGIEGHTDNQPQPGAANSQRLSAERAVALFEHIVRAGKIPPTRMSVAGHGGNHPIVSNATPAGRQRNQRIELVIYTEGAGH
jgi:flagellar motor protein MotB